MANLKSLKKGDKVILRVFTGAYCGTRTIEMADDKRIGFTSMTGNKMVFSKETGKQIIPKPKKEQYASYLDDWSKAVELAERAKKKPKVTARKPSALRKLTKNDFEELE